MIWYIIIAFILIGGYLWYSLEKQIKDNIDKMDM